jgi:hypothetical protein
MSWKGAKERIDNCNAPQLTRTRRVLVTRAVVKQLIMNAIAAKRFPLNDQKDDR